MQEFNTNDKYFITKKLSDDDFQEKTLDELKADPDADVYIPAFKKDSYNCKIPVSEFGKGGGANSNIVLLWESYINPITEEPELRIKVLDDEAATVWEMPDDMDFMEQVQTILGQDYLTDIGDTNSPVIGFKVHYTDHTEIMCYAHLCNVNYCGYMFTTFIPRFGHRYICLRYNGEGAGTYPEVKVTMSARNISIRNGEIDED